MHFGFSPPLWLSLDRPVSKINESKLRKLDGLIAEKRRKLEEKKEKGEMYNKYTHTKQNKTFSGLCPDTKFGNE